MPKLHRWVALLVALAIFAPAAADARKRAKRPKRYQKTENKEHGGTHWRIKTENGPIHVWVPNGYKRASAGTVVYVHGYGTRVDTAWKHHQLPQQFHTSRQNAIFIVPEAPIGKHEGIHFDSLAALKKAVVRANFRLPDGPTVVIGHSGAFRTVAKWLDNRLLAEVILLDALYGRQAEFEKFINSGRRAKQHKMIVIAHGTRAKSRKFAKQFRWAKVRDSIPKSYAGFTKNQKRAKLLYLRSQYGHMAIVTNGKVIPLILRLTPLKRL